MPRFCKSRTFSYPIVTLQLALLALPKTRFVQVIKARMIFSLGTGCEASAKDVIALHRKLRLHRIRRNHYNSVLLRNRSGEHRPRTDRLGGASRNGSVNGRFAAIKKKALVE